ncbi:MAG: peptide ABC transporter substrate-binding protein [Steroidobacteraceae bacterium]
MSLVRVSWRIVVALSSLVLLAACDRDPAEAAARPPNMLLRGNGPEPESLDPQKARQDSSLNILRDVYEGLTALDARAEPIPAAARSWDISPDGLQYRFQLQPGLKWSNGEALTASDFVTALKRLVDPKTAAPYAQMLEPVVNASAIVRGELPMNTLGATALDDRSLEITLTHPAPYLLGVLAHPATFPIYTRALTDSALVTNGAYRLREWRAGSYVQLERNEHYWNANAVAIPLVRYEPTQDPATELRRFRAGELDITYTIPGQQTLWIEEHLRTQLQIEPQLGVYYYGFNLRAPPFANQREVREALSLVIERDRLAAQVTRSHEQPACSWVPPGVTNYSPQPLSSCVGTHVERVARASRLYADAGYSRDRPLEVQLRYPVGDLHNRLAVVIAAMWKDALGVRTTLRAEEPRALNQAVAAGIDVQIFRASWIADYNDAWSFLQLAQSDFGVNLTGYDRAEFDSCLARAAAANDPQVRRAELERAERLLLADHALVPLYFYVSKHLVSPRVQGFASNALNVQYSRQLKLVSGESQQ